MIAMAMSDPKSAESPEDKGVDACIADVQAALDKLKAAQRKDVEDESGEDYGPKPKNLKQAGDKAYRMSRASQAADKAD